MFPLGHALFYSQTTICILYLVDPSMDIAVKSTVIITAVVAELEWGVRDS